MSILDLILGDPALRTLDKLKRQEVDKLITNLVKIGVQDDFLSLTPGGPFDVQCHHREARQIGKRLHELGGMALMEAARGRVKRKLKAVMAEHLDHCWKGIGDWQA